MFIEASKVNSCGIYCMDCPRKYIIGLSFITEGTTTVANNPKHCHDISVHCEHADFCQFLIERIHSIDSMEGIFGGDKCE